MKHNRLNSLHGPLVNLDLRLFSGFERGISSLKEEERSLRLSTVVTENNVFRVELMIKEDPRLAYKNIQVVLGISSPSVGTILHDQLMRKISFRWVSHSLPEGRSAQG